MRLAIPTTDISRQVEVRTKLSELDRRTSTDPLVDQVRDLSVVGRHSWVGSGTINGAGTLVPATAWSAEVDSGYVSQSAGSFTLLRPGRWAVHLIAISNSTVAGVFSSLVQHATFFDAAGELRDSRFCEAGTAFNYSGTSDQALSWTTSVTSPQLTNPFTIAFQWRPAADVARTASFRFTLNYLGGTSV